MSIMMEMNLAERGLWRIILLLLLRDPLCDTMFKVKAPAHRGNSPIANTDNNEVLPDAPSPVVMFERHLVSYALTDRVAHPRHARRLWHDVHADSPTMTSFLRICGYSESMRSIV
jgi:hypothetical protein